MANTRSQEIIVAIILTGVALLGDEHIPELSEGPAVVFQTSSLAGSLSYSWSLSLPANVRVRFD